MEKMEAVASLVPTAAPKRHRSVGRTIVVKCATVS